MAVARGVQEAMTRASWIRRMFERGAELVRQHGAQNVFDFTLGNPYLEPPAAFFDYLGELARRRGEGLHRYMPNAGFPQVRAAIAERLAGQEIFPGLRGEGVVMTVGAAGGMNIALKTLLDPGDEVIVLAPFFAEYGFYVANHGGVLKTVETSADFDVDVGAVAAAIGPRTKALIVNSPNNPTGRLYPRATLEALGGALAEAERRIGHPIYLIADDPYRELIYVDDPPPPAAVFHANSLLVYSWSKSLSVAGDRIGYVAVNPRADGAEAIAGGLTFTNRTLGYVNAPAVMQLAVTRLLDASIDVNWYRTRRDRLVAALRDLGFELRAPEGTFYLFPRSPDADDVAFVNRALEERVLLVPGTGFGRPGYVRLSYSVDDRTIDGGIAALARVMGRR